MPPSETFWFLFIVAIIIIIWKRIFLFLLLVKFLELPQYTISVNNFIRLCTWKKILVTICSHREYASQTLSVLFISSCHNKMPWSVWLKWQTLFSSQLWRLEIQDLGAAWSVSVKAFFLICEWLCLTWQRKSTRATEKEKMQVSWCIFI